MVSSSLAASPLTTLRIPTHTRPQPPNRSKRSADVPSPRHRDTARTTFLDHHGDGPFRLGALDDLKEGNEDDLERTSREVIQEALRQQWVIRDKVS